VPGVLKQCIYLLLRRSNTINHKNTKLEHHRNTAVGKKLKTW